MKLRSSLLLTVLSLIFVASCSNENIELEKIAVSTAALKSTLNVDNDTIIELREEDFPKNERKKTKSLPGDYVDIQSELSQLKGLDFFVQTSNYNYGKNTWTTNGKGSEITLGNLDYSNIRQKFRLRFLPASSGIPYLIYSSYENVPIGVGSYSSAPNEYILYAKKNDTGSLWGFSWDFYLNKNQDAYVIENQDIIGGGPNYWDIFYYSVTSSYNSNKIRMQKTNKLIDQQFTFIPDDEFEIISIELKHNEGKILLSKPTLLDKNSVENSSYTQTLSHTFSYSETQSDGASFQEQNSISTRKTGGFNISLALSKVVTLGASSSLEKGQSQTLVYGKTSQMTTQIIKSTNIPVPPRERMEYEFIALKHELDVPYIATLKGKKTQQTIKIRGQWQGVDYNQTALKTYYYKLDGTKALVRSECIRLD